MPINQRFHSWNDRIELNFVYVGVRISNMARENGYQYMSDFMPIARCRKWMVATLLEEKLKRMKLPKKLARLTPEMAPGRDCIVLFPEMSEGVETFWYPALVKEVRVDTRTGVQIGDVIEEWVYPSIDRIRNPND